jgi:hypothetical protein
MNVRTRSGLVTQNENHETFGLTYGRNQKMEGTTKYAKDAKIKYAKELSATGPLNRGH